MNSNFSSSFSRRGPDNITEELVVVLSGPKSYEFKALFLVIQAALRARNATSGGEEMLRLRAYDKLQNLVQHGQVKKTGKQYKGVRKGLLLLAENLKALRENGPSHYPRLPPPVRVTALRAGAWPRNDLGLHQSHRKPSLVAEAKQGNRSPGESSSGRRSFAYGERQEVGGQAARA